MHHRPILTNEEGVGARDFDIVGALDAVRRRDVEDREPAVVGGFDALAGAQVLRLDPARALDVPGMVVGDLEDLTAALASATRPPIARC
jgi:hypothetical protein